MTSPTKPPFVSVSSEMVKVTLLHAAVYHTAILDPQGVPLKRKVQWNEVEISVDALNRVYVQPDNDGTAMVPKDVAREFLANGFAKKYQNLVDTDYEDTPAAATTAAPSATAPADATSTASTKSTAKATDPLS